jgi:hypothetical protein
MAKKSGFCFRFPGLFAFVSCSVFASSFFPSIYVGDFLVSRSLNVSFYLYVLLIFLNMLYWCGWASEKNSKKQDSFSKKQKHVSKTGSPGTALSFTAVIFFIIVFAAKSAGDPDSVAGLGALRSLVNGEAKAYHIESLEREAIYNDPAVLDVEVRKFSRQPRLLTYSDITEDAQEWKNKSVARYYDKNSVVAV